MKYCLIIVGFFCCSICWSQRNQSHDINNLVAIADSTLLSKFGQCIFRKHLRLKNVEIIEEENEYSHKVSSYILEMVHTSKTVSYILSYSFILDKQEVMQVDLRMNESSEIQRGGVINYFSDEKILEEDCYLISHFDFTRLERKIAEMHKMEGISKSVSNLKK